MADMNAFGNRLRQLREEKELNQLELAKALSVANSTISQYEAGNRMPDAHMLERLATYFNVSIDYLLGRDNEQSVEAQSDTHRRIEAAIADDPNAEELLSFWKEMKEREDLQLLFKQVRPLSDDSIRRVVRIIKAIEDEEDREFNS